jgi:hypothetical protein
MFPWDFRSEVDLGDCTDSQYICCRLSGGILSKLPFLRLNKPILLKISLTSNPYLIRLLCKCFFMYSNFPVTFHRCSQSSSNKRKMGWMSSAIIFGKVRNIRFFLNVSSWECAKYRTPRLYGVSLSFCELLMCILRNRILKAISDKA